MTGARRASQHDRPRAARRRARLHALLGRRAPRHADAREREPRGADRADRRRHLAAAPGRQRRRDAAPLQPAQGRRELQHPQRAVPRPDRPRHRPRARHRPAHHVRAPARPPPGHRRTTSPTSSRSCSPTSRTASRRSIRSRASARCPGGRSAPEPWLLGSSPQSAIWAAQLGMRYSFADFINPGGAEIAQLYRDKFTSGERLPRTRALGLRLGDLRGHRRGGRSGSPRAAGCR